jgi:membrane-associated protease RseP (regulator of RpoE activity)
MSEKKKKIPWGSILALPKLLKLTKILKVTKSIKYLATALTMLASIFVYGWRFGWQFGLGFVILIFIHELGHVWAAKKKGYPVKAPIFIPMLGAVIFMPPTKTRPDESFIGIGGPVWGTIVSLILFGVYLCIPHPPEILVVLSFVGIYMNLFNMIPIRPLDGGRILQSAGSFHKWIGLVLLVAYGFFLKHPSILLIGLLVVDDFTPHLGRRFMMQCILLASMVFGYVYIMEFSWIFSMDVALGLLVTTLTFYRFRFQEEVVQEADTRSYPPRSEKVMWVLWYLCMVGIMVFALVVMQKYIPSHMLSK